MVIRNEFYLSKLDKTQEPPSYDSQAPLVSDTAKSEEAQSMESTTLSGREMMTKAQIIRTCAPDIYSVFITLLGMLCIALL